MILRPQTRPQALLQAVVKPWLSSTRTQTRSLHKVPELSNAARWEKEGVTGVLSPEAFKASWTEYQSNLCDYLNLHTQGTSDEGLSARALVNKYAHNPVKAALFNYASMATNNHQFFNSLSSDPVKPSHSMLEDIKSDFDSFENLRTEFLETADAMFGNGFVWLMKEDQDPGTGRLRILCTYNAGSPFREAHYRQQSRDMATEFTNPNGSRIAANLSSPSDRLFRVQNTAGFFGNSSAQAVLHHPNALLATPILGLCVWEHMWLPDYGIRGKRTYLQAWWNRIDWGVVQQTALTRSPPSAKQRPSSGLTRTLERSMANY